MYANCCRLLRLTLHSYRTFHINLMWCESCRVCFAFKFSYSLKQKPTYTFVLYFTWSQCVVSFGFHTCKASVPVAYGPLAILETKRLKIDGNVAGRGKETMVNLPFGDVTCGLISLWQPKSIILHHWLMKNTENLIAQSHKTSLNTYRKRIWKIHWRQPVCKKILRLKSQDACK